MSQNAGSGEPGAESAAKSSVDQRIMIFWAIREERLRQERLCREGKFAHTCADLNWDADRKLGVLMEEVGEVAKVLNEVPVWRPMNNADRKVLREELIQVAAVAVAWVESIDLRDGGAK